MSDNYGFASTYCDFEDCFNIARFHAFGCDVCWSCYASRWSELQARFYCPGEVLQSFENKFEKQLALPLTFE